MSLRQTAKAVVPVSGDTNYYTSVDIKKILSLYIRQTIIASIKYENLPEGIQAWDIERLLFDYGGCGFVRHAGEYFALQYVAQTFYGVYARPDNFSLITVLQKPINKIFKNYKDGFIIPNNIDYAGTQALIEPYLKRLQSILNASDLNRKLSQVFAAVIANQSNYKTIKTEWKSFLANPSGLFITSSEETLKTLKETITTFNVQYKPSEYWEDYDKTFNEMLKMLGISYNDHPNKKEKQTDDEVTRTDNFTLKVTERFLQTRKYVIDMINKTYDLNIKVSIVNDEEEEEEKTEEQTKEKGNVKNDISGSN